MGNESTAEMDVSVAYGADIRVSAVKYMVGWGHRPCVWRERLAGISVGAYDNSEGSCAAYEIDQHWGVVWWAIPFDCRELPRRTSRLRPVLMASPC